MKRDLDLMRHIMLAVEADIEPWNSEDVKKYPRELVPAHVELLIDQGYLEGQIHYSAARSGKKEADSYHITRITNAGYDFLDASRNPAIWKKTLDFAKEKGGSFALDIIVELLKQAARHSLGLGAG